MVQHWLTALWQPGTQWMHIITFNASIRYTCVCLSLSALVCLFINVHVGLCAHRILYMHTSVHMHIQTFVCVYREREGKSERRRGSKRNYAPIASSVILRNPNLLHTDGCIFICKEPEEIQDWQTRIQSVFFCRSASS